MAADRRVKLMVDLIFDGNLGEALELFDAIEEKADAIAALEEIGIAFSNRFKDKTYAEAIFNKIVSADPGNAGAHFNLGLLYEKMNDPKRAEGEYKMSIKLLPQYTTARFNLAMMYAALGKFKEAEREYKDLIRISPEFAPAHYNLAVMYMSMGNTDDGEKYFDSTVKADSRFKDLCDQAIESYYEGAGKGGKAGTKKAGPKEGKTV